MMRSIGRLCVGAVFAMLMSMAAFSGGAAFAAPTTPTADFTDNGDGTVTHKTTGLTWKRCAEGMAWTRVWTFLDCSGTAQTYTWAQAAVLTATFADKSDWRLPTVRELSTITEVEAINPAINSTIFSNTPASLFWSASAYAGDSRYAWHVYFGYGGDGTNGKTNSFQVRLVRGGQSLGLLALSRPTTDYADNGDGTVTHTPTALTWKRCAEGQTWSGSTCSGTATTTTWAAATALTGTFAGKSDWRLPTLAELRSLVDFTIYNPSINRTIFPNTPSSYFWSASAYAGYSDFAWGVHFGAGSDSPDSKTGSHSVRLVRGGQAVGTPAPTVSLNGMSLNCPSTLASSTSGTCSATASYSDGSSKAVSPAWSSSNTTALYVGSGGNIVPGTPNADAIVTISASYTEGGVTKTATATVTVKAAAATLTGLSATCPATVNAGATATCAATATYSNNTSNSVSATWASSNSAVATMNGSTLTAGNVSTDTPVSITATYTENGITQTATAMVSIKAAAACNQTLSAGSVSASASGGSYSVNVTSNSGSAACPWNAGTTTSWLHLTAASGTGNGTLGFTVDANTGTSSRIGTITVGSQTYTVTQAGASTNPTSSADCVFSWGEKNYPELFSPNPAISKAFGDYYYRYYSDTKSYLGTFKAQKLVYLGALSKGEVLDLGDIATWTKTAGCQ